jgi:hypothetical protein
MTCVHVADNESPPCVAISAATWQTSGERAVSACMLVETRNSPVISRTPSSNVGRCGGVFSLARARQERDRDDVVHAPIHRNKLETRPTTCSDSLHSCSERMRQLDCMVSGAIPTTNTIFPSMVTTCITASTGDPTSNAVAAVSENNTSLRSYPRGSTFALLSQQVSSKEQRRHEIVNRSSELDRRLTMKNPKAYPAGATSNQRAGGDVRSLSSTGRQEIAMVSTSRAGRHPAESARRRTADGAAAAAEW